MSTPAIQWYPGHIAKAAQQLTQHLSKVDLVIVARGGRFRVAVGHPELKRWFRGRQQLVLITAILQSTLPTTLSTSSGDFSGEISSIIRLSTFFIWSVVIITFSPSLLSPSKTWTSFPVFSSTPPNVKLRIILSVDASPNIFFILFRIILLMSRAVYYFTTVLNHYHIILI